MILDSMLGHHAVLLVAASVLVAGVYLLRQLGRMFSRCARGWRPGR
jgi:hypothetical protein